MIDIMYYFIGAAAAVYINDLIFKKIETKSTAAHILFLHSMIRILVIIISTYACAAHFPQSQKIGQSVLRSGSFALALVTFAAQQTLGNVIGGFSISLAKPYKIGQKIRVLTGGENEPNGIVTGMTMRHTIIHQYDDQECIVPNSVMNSKTIINMDYTDSVSSILQFEISDPTKVAEAKELIGRICRSEMRLLNRENIAVYTYDTDTSGIIIRTSKLSVADINTNYGVRSDLIDAVIASFAKAKIDLSINLAVKAPVQ